MEYEIINQDGGLIADAGDKIIEFETQIKKLQALEKEFKEELLKQMQNRKVKTVAYKNLTISLVKGSFREEFNKKKFREEHEDLYNKYVSLNETNDSIRMVLKEVADDGKMDN